MSEIFVYGPIGADFGGVDAKGFAQEIQSIDGPVTIRLNSPGGIVSEGWAIYQAMKRHPHEVTVSIDAEAASIATVIAMGANKVEIADHALMMIHHPWTFAMGNANELRQVADMLDTHGERSIALYQAKSGEDREKVVEWMDQETWFTAAEAVENGFADTLVETMAVAAWKVPEGWFKNTPKELVDEKDTTKREAFIRKLAKMRRKQIGAGSL